MHCYPTPWTKRLFDIGLSFTGLLLSAPLWPLIAAAIKLEDGGPIFYGQERVGKGGVTFKSWKFRSMTADPERREELQQAAKNDKRVTKVGGLLRATAMDELPQLWNIFTGEMSFVGPRPLMPREFEVHGSGEAIALQEIPGYQARHGITPGLTGLAQIFAPRDLPRKQKFRLDLLYIKKQSLKTDIWFIVLSFWITFRGKWEHRGKKI
jgi:lipopolysaccharide/colanic/teichoic acid biosynthesis glycosyltransferase